MLHSVEFLRKKFICYSALCNSVWNSSQKFSCRLHTMLHSTESQLRAMHHCAESLIFLNFSANSHSYAKMISPTNQWSKWDRLMKKAEGRKSCEAVPLIRNSKYKNFFRLKTFFPFPQSLAQLWGDQNCFADFSDYFPWFPDSSPHYRFPPSRTRFKEIQNIKISLGWKLSKFHYLSEIFNHVVA
jgi:hypothetical protein